MLDSIRGLHIEPTNMCALKCSKCSRTEFIEQFGQNKWKNYNIDLAQLKNFLDIDLQGKKILLCGVYGDPIYYPDLIPMVEYFKDQGAQLSISTNGSYKTKLWWNELATLLDSTDSVYFGIDGTPDNFLQYRTNADWDSIQLGIDTIAYSSARMIWQFIPFAYNETNIEDCRQLSVELGFDEFEILHSNRWVENDPLMPKSTSLVKLHGIEWKQGEAKDTEIVSKCKQDNQQHYVNSKGYYMPCCFVDDYRFYYKTEFYKNQKNYSISNTTISEILSQNTLIDFYRTLEDAKLSYCTYSCPKHD